MQILHGTWIPQAENAFVRSGAFYLWVETLESKKFRGSKRRHPQQLVAADLAVLLADEFGIQGPSPLSLEDFIEPCYFL